jgi:murein DD-endopeptidase MepM/ murein hydrolase activator NlpD
MAKVTSVVDTVMAEAGGKTPAERFRDMKAIASVIANRARMLGVSMQDVVGIQSEFNAFGKKMPAGVESLRAMAEQAVADVVNNGPINNATFYSTPETTDNLPSGLSKEDETAGHHFFSDPQARAIRTVQGYIDPADTAIAASYAPVDRVSAEPSAFDSLFGGYAAAPQESFAGPTGLLSAEAAPSGNTGLLGVDRSGFSSPFGALGDRVTSGFGYRQAPQTPMGIGSSLHQGIDMSLQGGASGYPAEAAAAGTVTYAGPMKGYGNMVELSHPNGMKTRYGHLAEIGNLAIGDEVAMGTPVGTVGNTGRSKGAHLHFETIDPVKGFVDPSTVVDFNPQSRVPTPVSRPTPSFGVLAAAEQPSLLGGVAATANVTTPTQGLLSPEQSLADRMTGTADIAQGYAEARDSLLGQTPIGRVSDQQMADMQTEANRSRQAMEMNKGFLSLSPDQLASAMDRRATAMNVLSATPSIGAVATADQPNPFGGVATTADLTTPASTPMSMPSNVALTQQLTGLAPTMTATTKVGALQPGLLDISAPTSVNEFTGFVNNPAVTRAKQIGVQPTTVQSVGLLNPSAMAVADQPTVAGPVTAGLISSVNQTPSVDVGVTARSKPAKNSVAKNTKTMTGTVVGGVVGNMIAGPLGGVIGAVLGRQAAQQGLAGSAATGSARMGINNLGSGAQAAYGAWGGRLGDMARATDGSTITNLGNGLVSRVDRNGVETRFSNGQIVGGSHSPGLGGILGGMFGGLFGGGTNSTNGTNSGSGGGGFGGFGGSSGGLGQRNSSAGNH